MKKMVFYFFIALAIFFPNSNQAHDVKHELGCGIIQRDDTLGGCLLDIENLFVDDFNKIVFDNDTNDSERKKFVSKTVGNTNYSNTAFIPQKFTKIYFPKNLGTKLFFNYRTSLFIFIRVLRL